MYPPDTKPTRKERLLNFANYIYIEPNHIGVVYRDSQFAYFLPTGWHPPLNRWNEQLVAQIPIKLFTEELKLEALAADGPPHDLVLSIAFNFNPMKASRNRQAEAASLALNGTNGRLIREKVLREAKYAARKAIDSYDADELLCGHIRRRAEREIRHHLQAVLTDLGVSIDPASGVFIEALTPPEVVTRVQSNHYERRKTIELLEQHPEKALQMFLLEALTQQNGLMIFNNRSVMQNVLDNMYTTAFTNPVPHPSPADDFQTRGIVLPNISNGANGKYQGEVMS